MNRIPKLLITGASGFTGQHACEHFIKAGFNVTATTRNNFVELNMSEQNTAILRIK